MLAKKQKRKEILRKLPEVLDIQKKKLLFSMKQPPGGAAEKFSAEQPLGGAAEKFSAEQPPDGAAEKFSAEQEMLAKEVTQTLQTAFGISKLKSYNDICTDIINQSNRALKSNATFELKKYLKCVKCICIIFKDKYKGQIPYSKRRIVNNQMEYILTHARQFSDPSKSIFEIETEAATTMPKQVDIDLRDEEQGQELDIVNRATALIEELHQAFDGDEEQGQELAIVNRATALIEELHQAFDEEKLRALNALATSFTLVIARRFIKRRQHNNQNTMPIYFLIVQAYLTTDDEKTKKNLYDTCIKHMEWYDMHMPSLFFKVLDLYNIEAGELWDALMSTAQMKLVEYRIILSLIDFAEAYYNFYQKQKLQWFPFLSFFNNFDDWILVRYCKSGLSDKSNVRIGMVLHSLVEMASKEVYKVNWNYKDMSICLDWARETAAEIMTKITK